MLSTYNRLKVNFVYDAHDIEKYFESAPITPDNQNTEHAAVFFQCLRYYSSNIREKYLKS